MRGTLWCTNIFGVPRERCGFSRDARGAFGPPKFADSAIRVDGADAAVEINLR
jgi:uncharacterized protein (DUF2141 family)